MSVRKRLLLPDVTANTIGGEIDIVSRQQVLEAMADAVVMQELAGGFITIAVTRVPTGFPDEMVTVSACIEWKDRSDAKQQPEPVAQVLPQTSSAAPAQSVIELACECTNGDRGAYMGRDGEAHCEQCDGLVGPVEIRVEGGTLVPEGFKAAQEIQDAANSEVEGLKKLAEDPSIHTIESPDGLDESALEEEDLSEIPAEVR